MGRGMGRAMGRGMGGDLGLQLKLAWEILGCLIGICEWLMLQLNATDGGSPLAAQISCNLCP